MDQLSRICTSYSRYRFFTRTTIGVSLVMETLIITAFLVGSGALLSEAFDNRNHLLGISAIIIMSIGTSMLKSMVAQCGP